MAESGSSEAFQSLVSATSLHVYTCVSTLHTVHIQLHKASRTRRELFIKPTALIYSEPVEYASAFGECLYLVVFVCVIDYSTLIIEHVNFGGNFLCL